MSIYRRNVLVGVTVLVALGLLAWMIFRFGGDFGELFAGETMKVSFRSDRADGLSAGSAIWFRGVSVGRVVSVRRDPNLEDIIIEGSVEADPPLPADVSAVIRQTSLLGSAGSIELQSNGDMSQHLQPNAEIPLKYVGLELLPSELRELSTELTATIKQFRDANLIGSLTTRLDEVGAVLNDMRSTLGGVNKIVNDEKLQKNVTDSLEAIRVSSESIRNTTAAAERIASNFEATASKLNSTVDSADETVKATRTHIDTLAKQTTDRMGDLARLMAQANDIANKINEGKGTAGKIVNDPKLYDGLVDTTTQLSATIRDLQRLIQQWEQEGVPLKLR